MATSYKTPGVYIEEVPKFPPSVAAVETDVPAFIGYTRKADHTKPNDLFNVPFQVSSMLEFNQYFGDAPAVVVADISLDNSNNFVDAKPGNRFFLHDSMTMFFANGGSKCYIVSIGKTDQETIAGKSDFLSGLAALAKEALPAIIVMPDAVKLEDADLGFVQEQALEQCQKLVNRVAIFDTRPDDPHGDNFRNNIAGDHLRYGAAYTPWLQVSIPKKFDYRQVRSVLTRNGVTVQLKELTTDGNVLALLEQLEQLDAGDQVGQPDQPNMHNQPGDIDLLTSTDNALGTQALHEQLVAAFPLYKSIIDGISRTASLLPPSGAIAGVYAANDNARGVWKAPANISLNMVLAPAVSFTNAEADLLNIDVAHGKSINTIRAFTGKGTLVWGARTLAGNDNEWRYISVRRFISMVEASCQKSTEGFVFEPNDANTWVRIQAMIENFLYSLWRSGALQGAKPEHGFYVAVGLNKTMTARDILEGRLIVEIGLAVIRPAEFIILKFSHKMSTD